MNVPLPKAADTSNSIASVSGIAFGDGVQPRDNSSSQAFGTGVLPPDDDPGVTFGTGVLPRDDDHGVIEIGWGFLPQDDDGHDSPIPAHWRPSRNNGQRDASIFSPVPNHPDPAPSTTPVTNYPIPNANPVCDHPIPNATPDFEDGSTTHVADDSILERPISQDSMYQFNSEDPQGFTMLVRKNPPAHYRFVISSFKILRRSMLSGRCEPNHIESTEFNAAGFRWVLLIYPNGNLKQHGKDYLSLYLKMVPRLDQSSAVKATLKFFIYNFKKEEYLIIKGKDVTYDHINWQRGIAKALPLSDLEDPIFGFMEDESCRIGIEVTAANHANSDRTRFGHLFIPKGHRKGSHDWQVCDYKQKLRENCTKSKEITMKGRTWYVIRYHISDDHKSHCDIDIC
ncbi:hypothetical protein Ancab_017017 [Ancistrocladus abbreviatus]